MVETNRATFPIPARKTTRKSSARTHLKSPAVPCEITDNPPSRSQPDERGRKPIEKLHLYYSSIQRQQAVKLETIRDHAVKMSLEGRENGGEEH